MRRVLGTRAMQPTHVEDRAALEARRRARPAAEDPALKGCLIASAAVALMSLACAAVDAEEAVRSLQGG